MVPSQIHLKEISALLKGLFPYYEVLSAYQEAATVLGRQFYATSGTSTPAVK